MVASTLPSTRSGLYADPNENWLALHTEPVLDPARPIIDPHHHLWDRGGVRYMMEEMTDDIAMGHNIIATVYVEARSFYRASGPEAFRPVGEVEFVNGVAAMAASGAYGKALICHGIVGHVNLLLGDGAKAVLEAEIAAGNGRFRGIRHSSPWDADKDVAGIYAERPKGLLLDPTFRKGFACLAPLGLSFDAWLFYHQLGEFADLARAFPDTQHLPRSLRRHHRHRQLCRPARRDLQDLEGVDPGGRQMQERRGQARRACDGAAGLRLP